MDRRTFGKWLSAAALTAPAALPGIASPALANATPVAGSPAIAMLVFPNLTVLDLVAPHALLAFLPGRTVHLVWKDRAPIVSDAGIVIEPTTVFADVPDDVEILFVPGGARGTIDAMNDPEVLDFLADCGQRATWVTSVCTGSLLLGAAGLLDGYQATGHWAFRDLLPLFGAEVVAERVVTDRNRVTAGGITAGLDFGLQLFANLVGEEEARKRQLVMEYDPHPPFQAGTPETAGPETASAVRDMLAPGVEAAREAALRLVR